MADILYIHERQGLRTTVDEAKFNNAGDPAKDGFDHHHLYPRDPKTGKPLIHELPYRQNS